MGATANEKVAERLDFVFWGSMGLQFVAAAAIFIARLAGGYKRHEPGKRAKL